jgi:hypothetical protein
MSGGIRFKKGVFWGKAGWCYRAAREGICDALRQTPEGSTLADEISAESHPAQWCEHLDIDEWPKEKKALFFQAVYRCADRFAKEGPVGWHDPSFFPGFLRAMEELAQTARSIEAEHEDAEPEH